MKAVLLRPGWLLTGVAAVALSVGLSYVRQGQVVGRGSNDQRQHDCIKSFV